LRLVMVADGLEWMIMVGLIEVGYGC